MSIDAALLDYSAELITESGAVYRLDNALLSLSWEEQEGQLAQKAMLTIVNAAIGSKWIMSYAKINCMIRIYGMWGAGRQLLFEGYIWEWQYVSESNKEFSITAYDPLIRLQQSKDFKYFSAGLTTPALLESICSDWGITLDYQWSKQITHQKKVFNGETISDMIVKTLDEVRQQTGEKYVLMFKEGKLLIDDYGKNNDVYKFTFENTISTTDRLSISNLVTKVKIIGKADDDGRSSVDAVEDGDQQYGVLQEIVKHENKKDLGDAKAEAQAILKERGKPAETISVNTPDLPFLRRGYKIEMAAGNLLGQFYVIGVSHNAAAKQMTMTLMRKE